MRHDAPALPGTIRRDVACALPALSLRGGGEGGWQRGKAVVNMLTYLDESRRRAEDERWYAALLDLLAGAERLSLSSEAARRFALSASADEIEDRTRRLEHRRAA